MYLYFYFIKCSIDYMKEKQIFVLNFRGLSFEFKIDSKLEVSNTTLPVYILCYMYKDGISGLCN